MGPRTYSENLLSTIDWMVKLNEREHPQSLAEALERLSGGGSRPDTGVCKIRNSKAREMNRATGIVFTNPLILKVVLLTNHLAH